MQKVKTILKNEEGSIIVISIMILALLTVIGISATRTSTVETQISTNDFLNFYAAESGWQVSANWLDSQYPLSTIDRGLDMTGGVVDFTNPKYNTPDSFQLAANKSFSVRLRFTGAYIVPGYSTEFKRYRYEIDSDGIGPLNSQAQVGVTARKIEYVGGY